MVQRSEPEYGIVIAKDVMVPMRDGVRLATDIYRPAVDGEPAPGRFPTLLGRTSYNKDSDWLWGALPHFFTSRGYVVAIQDLRGRQHSEGAGQYFHVANPMEGPDGYDTVEWLAAQPWSDGRVGTTGSSHGAIVQQVMALYRPPHLTAIWPDVGPTNSYAHQAREGGAMQLHMFGAQFLHAQDAQEIANDPVAKQAIMDAMHHLREWVYRTPFKPGHTPLRVVPNLEKTLFDYYYRGAYDAYWQQDCNDQERYFDRHADIPGLFSGGWFDPYSVATTYYYHVMSGQNSTPQRLVIGPWTHEGMRQQFSVMGDVDFGPEAIWGQQRYDDERLRWFDRWLKGIPTGVEDDPPVRIFVMGGGDGHRTADGHLYHGGVWREENEWPLARARPTDFYLRSGGCLDPSAPDGSDPPARFAYDPAHPVPTISANVTGFFEMVPVAEGVEPHFVNFIPPRVRMRTIVRAGATHQKEEPGIIGAQFPYPALAERADVLVFQTAPLTDDVEITGVCEVTLWVSSSAVDTDFTAKLIDVHPPNPDYPDGYHMNLVDSIIRARYRDGWESEELMTPGEIYQVRIRLPPTSNLFAAGHRIRVDISSSNFPRFDLNPNTGEPMGRHTHTVVAHNTIHLDREHPSRVVLPIIPQ